MRTRRNRNEITINGDVAKITLYDRKCNVVGYATIDAEDVDRIKKYKWHKNSQGYVASTNDNKIIRLHRFIMGLNGCYDGKTIIDHINGNRLDNRKCNLRVANLSINSYNLKKTREGKVGVTKWVRGKQTYYKAYIYVNHKRVNIGNFHTEEEARKARRNAEIKYGIDKYIGNNPEVKWSDPEPRELILKPINEE